ncbi:MAG: hypothetical protein ACK56F_25035 [bacterium]
MEGAHGVEYQPVEDLETESASRRLGGLFGRQVFRWLRFTIHQFQTMLVQDGQQLFVLNIP